MNLFKFKWLFVSAALMVSSLSAAAQPNYLNEESARSLVAKQICFGPFSEQEHLRCASYLAEGEFHLADPTEYEVLRNLVLIANVEYVPQLGDFEVVSRMEDTLDLLALVEGRIFPTEILSLCPLYVVRFDGRLMGRNDHQYVQCVLRHSSPAPKQP